MRRYTSPQKTGVSTLTFATGTSMTDLSIKMIRCRDPVKHRCGTRSHFTITPLQPVSRNTCTFVSSTRPFINGRRSSWWQHTLPIMGNTPPHCKYVLLIHYSRLLLSDQHYVCLFCHARVSRYCCLPTCIV